MTDKELSDLISKGETQFVDFKDARIRPATLARTLVAFANTNAGRVIVGIDDSTREPTGITNREEVLDNLHRSASLDCCEPAISISIEERTYKGQPVFVMTVPYQYEAMYTTEGRVLIRRGTENVSASTHEITALTSRRGRLKYEKEVPQGATLDDLDMTLLEAYRMTYLEMRKKRLTLPDMSLMQNLGSVVEQSGNYYPTVAGILVFGNEPQRFVPQSRLVIVRYPGTNITRNILDSREIEGRLPEMIDSATDYLSEHIQMGSIRDMVRFGARREDIPEYPLPAVREVIINALAHREFLIEGARVLVKWFTDQIEVTSPGGFMEPITPETIYTSAPVHRNANLMKMLYGYGFVEGYGDGVHMVREQFESHPLKPRLPKFEAIPTGVKVTLYAADLNKLAEDESAMRWADQGLNERQIQAMLYVERTGRITRKEHTKNTGISERTAHRDLSELVGRGLLELNGSGRYVYYVLSKSLRDNQNGTQ